MISTGSQKTTDSALDTLVAGQLLSNPDHAKDIASLLLTRPRFLKHRLVIGGVAARICAAQILAAHRFLLLIDAGN